MSELGEVKAQAIVASGYGWAVGKAGDGFDVRIDRATSTGYFGTTVPHPATDVEREEAKDRLLDSTTEELELARIEEAFSAPWQQA